MPTQFPNLPSVISVSDLTVGGTIDVRGNAIFNQIFFDSQLISKINLYATSYGIGISSYQQNFFVGGGASIVFYSGGDNNTGTEIARVNASGLTINDPAKVTINGYNLYPIVTPSVITDISGQSNWSVFAPSDARRITILFHNIGTTVGTFPPRFNVYGILAGSYNVFSQYVVTQGLSSAYGDGIIINMWSVSSWGTAVRMSGSITFTFIGYDTTGYNVYYAVEGGAARIDSPNWQDFTYAGTILQNGSPPVYPATKFTLSVGSGLFTTGSYYSINYE